jgi:hypothetical protein
MMGRSRRNQGHVIAAAHRLWQGGILPYEFDPDLERARDADEKAVGSPAALIRQAIAEWNEKTLLKLLPRTEQPDYVHFARTDDVSESEYVGRNGGRQSIVVNVRRASLLESPYGGGPLGVMVHEIGHAIGLLHEHQRSDRDQHISIQWDNIAPDRRCNFCVHVRESGCTHCALKTGRLVGEYDYDSVMHYFKKQGAVDSSRPTIVAPKGRSLGSLAQLSPGDIATIATIYASEVGVA